MFIKILANSFTHNKQSHSEDNIIICKTCRRPRLCQLPQSNHSVNPYGVVRILWEFFVKGNKKTSLIGLFFTFSDPVFPVLALS